MLKPTRYAASIASTFTQSSQSRCRSNCPTNCSNARLPANQRSFPIRLLPLLAICLLPAATLHAQSSDETSGIDPFESAIAVRVVNIEAVVTNEDGKRVAGLTAQDFALEVDERAAPIDFFTEVSEGQLSRETAENDLPPGATPGRTLPTNLLLFIDDALTVRRDRDRVLESFRHQIEDFATPPNISIVAFDGRSLDHLTSWTDDPDQISSALLQAMQRPAHGALRNAERGTMDSWSRDREVLEKEQQILIEGSASGGDGASAA